MAINFTVWFIVIIILRIRVKMLKLINNMKITYNNAIIGIYLESTLHFERCKQNTRSKKHPKHVKNFLIEYRIFFDTNIENVKNMRKEIS